MGAQSLAVACGVLALCLTLAEATNPGFVVRITEAGFNMELRNFYLANSRISLVPSMGPQLSISNAFADVNGNWQAKKKIKIHGSFHVKLQDVNIKVNLKLGNDASGKPTIDTSSCTIYISKVRAKLSGKLSKIYNLFHKVIESKLKKFLEKKTCDIVAKSVRSDLQPYVQTLPVTAKIDAIAGVDYSLVGPPMATTQSLDVPMKGECYSLAQRSAVPFSPPALTLPPDHDRMVYFGVSSYFFNTASFAYHKSGALVFEITDSMIPKTVEFHLKTTTFSAFIPQLEEKYPDKEMKLKVSAPSAPFLNIGPGGLSLQPVVDVEAYAIVPDSSPAPLFLLSLTGNVSAVISVKSGHIIGNLTMDGMKLSLKRSDVGDFQVETLQPTMNIFASNILVPHINDRLGQGFPLPLLDRMQLSDIIVQFHQNLLLLGANVQYQPWV
ncbi:PREDICTED: lipopolysaccharide-binding protein-like [Calidris pugnax]|uniref:lipopolysaccharide-binding protein-like n=1 Tax=Calidris pugnax TaxID=198806 RepID=UPI00071CF4E2|nr:PREDICTED: lipopolysaccharide-binding protein-like [Calidris pugnax]